MNKVVIAGAGFAGATVARKLAEAGYTVDLYEKRNHVGGNAYDYVDESGSFVHQYGPHIFHTNLENVYSFLSNYTEWFPYEHKVLGSIDGKLVPIPFSLKSLEMCFPPEKAEKLKATLIGKYGLNNKVTISQLRKENDPELSELAEYVYEKVFLNYTKKQWGLLPEQLGEGVTGRVPVYVSYDERYFQDKFQYMPKDGYTKLFENLLNHGNIRLHLGEDILERVSFGENTVEVDGERCIFVFTGCIDELFRFSFGDLEYRSLDFDFEQVPENRYQPAAVVNYPNDYTFTRISEFKGFTVERPEDLGVTTIVREYPCAHVREKIPYYPIPLSHCEEKYRKYREYASRFENLYLIGRLAEYKYYNMDLVIASALKLAEDIVKGENA